MSVVETKVNKDLAELQNLAKLLEVSFEGIIETAEIEETILEALEQNKEIAIDPSQITAGSQEFRVQLKEFSQRNVMFREMIKAVDEKIGHIKTLQLKNSKTSNNFAEKKEDHEQEVKTQEEAKAAIGKLYTEVLETCQLLEALDYPKNKIFALRSCLELSYCLPESDLSMQVRAAMDSKNKDEQLQLLDKMTSKETLATLISSVHFLPQTPEAWKKTFSYEARERLKNYLIFINGHQFTATLIQTLLQGSHTEQAGISSTIELVKTLSLSKEGNLGAVYLLGVMCEYGIRVRKSEYLAIVFYKKAADEGYGPAQVAFGTYLTDDDYFRKNIQKAMELYNKAKDQNFLPACCAMAFVHIKGNSESQETAISILEQGAKQGCHLSQYFLGNFFKNGIFVKEDHKRAVELLTQAADQGFAYAQLSLGECYQDGRGLSQDLKRANELFHSAAEREGNPQAQFLLAEGLRIGEIVSENDQKRALELYQLAADQADVKASEKLGECFENGLLGLQLDLPRARALYLQAAAEGSAKGRAALGRCFTRGIACQANVILGLTLYRLCAKEEPSICWDIGFHYAWGVEQCFPIALKFYHLAGESGYMYMGFISAGRIYEKPGPEQNFRQALYCYRKVAGLNIVNSFDADGVTNLAGLYERGDGLPRDVKRAILLYQTALDFNRSTNDETEKKLQEALNRCYALEPESPRSLQESLQSYRKKAEEGDRVSIGMLAFSSQFGLGVERNLESAIEMYRGLILQGELQHLDDLFYCYQELPQDQQTPKEVEEFYNIIAKNTALEKKIRIEALNILAEIYEKGSCGVEKDFVRAADCHQKIHALDNKDEQAKLKQERFLPLFQLQTALAAIPQFQSGTHGVNRVIAEYYLDLPKVRMIK